MARIRLLIVTLWAGSLWTTGYMVAPTLFATLPDHVLAGTIAGNLFRIEAWLSVACAIAVLAFSQWVKQDAHEKKVQRVLVFTMLTCTVLGYFVLHPFMSALREAAGPSGVMNSNTRVQFGILHGISSGFYLIQSLLGAALVVKSK